MPHPERHLHRLIIILSFLDINIDPVFKVILTQTLALSGQLW